MRRLLVYLDTSVASAYFDERDQARMLTTREFWKRFEGYEVLISDLVIGEIRQITDVTRRRAIEYLLRKRVNAANLDLGYRGIDIRSPLEL